MSDNTTQREHWGSRLGFVLAAAGSAVGLGNIWKFPYITGENGGGAFVLIYLFCIAIIGLPVMLCEITLGRKTQRDPVGAFSALRPDSSTLAHVIGGGMVLTGLFLLAFQQWGWAVVALCLGAAVFRYSWTVVGAMGVFTGFVILSFYSVVGGWTLGYMVQAFAGELGFESVEAAEGAFGAFISNGGLAVGCHALFLTLCVLVVYRGVKNGIERWSKILMPVLFLLLVLLIVRGITLPNAMEGVRFFLSPDFSRLGTKGVLEALGHAFFSLSLGMGAMITYGSYINREENLYTSALSIVGLDTLIALLAGLAIFPAVFAQGFDPQGGPGLVFQVLPTVFAQIPLGGLWAGLFFLLLLVAALTSGISLLEVVTAYFVDERQWDRRRAAVVFGGVIFALGSLSALSVANWERLPAIENFLTVAFGSAGGSFFDVMDTLSSKWLLPLGGFFVSLFVGWVWGTRYAIEEIRHGSDNFADVHLASLLAGLKDDDSHNAPVHVWTLATVWGVFIRFISPTAVLIAFFYTIGWIRM